MFPDNCGFVLNSLDALFGWFKYLSIQFGRNNYQGYYFRFL